MTLQETIDLIMVRLGTKQTGLGLKLGIAQGNVSKMRSSPEWQQHWTVVLQLLDLCDELGIDPRRPAPVLKDTPKIAQVIPYGFHDRAKNIGISEVIDAKPTPKTPKESHSALPAGRIKKPPR